MLDPNKPSKWWIMAVNIWKSYMCTAVKETNIELILAVMNTTELVVEIGPEKKFRSVRDLNPWPLRYCSQEVGRNSRLRLVFLPTLLSCTSRFLRALQQHRAQSRPLYLLIKKSHKWLEFLFHIGHFRYTSTACSAPVHEHSKWGHFTVSSRISRWWAESGNICQNRNYFKFISK